MWSVHLALVRRAAHRRTVSLWRQVVRLGLAVDPVVVIAGLSNDYADYTTTYDEYQEQRYRAAGKKVKEWLDVWKSTNIRSKSAWSDVSKPTCTSLLVSSSIILYAYLLGIIHSCQGTRFHE